MSKIYFLLILLFSFSSPVSAGISEAVTYLANQQGVSGEIISNDTASTVYQSTSEAVRSAKFAGQLDQINAVLATETLADLSNIRNTEYLSRLIVISDPISASTQNLINEMVEHQNQDGGFGDYSGYDSTVLDTAYALDALAEISEQSADIEPAVNFLLQSQRVDGSWSDNLNNSDVYVTARAMRALWHYRDVFAGVSEALTAAELYLFSERDASTGLWAEIFESAMALIALVPFSSEFANIEGILANLNATQDINGSWQNDVFTTALVLRALLSKPVIKPEPVTTGSMSGRVIDVSTGMPIPSATIQIEGLALSTSSNNQGEFVLDQLDPMAYTVSVSAVGYTLISQSNINIDMGVDRSLGNIPLSPLPTSGVLVGNILDLSSGLPIASAVINITGSTNTTVITQANGAFSTSVNAGIVNISISKNGYLPKTASANVPAGNTLVLNQKLEPISLSDTPQEGVSPFGVIRGLVRDATTNLPLSWADVTVKDASNLSSIAFKNTNQDGTYEMNSLSPAKVIIEVNKDGYNMVGVNTEIKAGNVIIFDVDLVPVGGDTSVSNGGSISEELLPTTPNEGSVQGVVTDMDTGLPISGATINMTGSNTLTTATDVNGGFSIAGLIPGEIQVTASAQGYLEITGIGTVTAGNKTIFSPALTAEDYISSEFGQITGRVVDVISGDALRYVTVKAIANDNSEISVVTSLNGVFEFVNLVPGEYTLVLTKSNYKGREFKTVVLGSATNDVNLIELEKATTDVTLYGQIVDSLSNLPISGAIIRVAGTTFSAITDSEGKYQISGFEPGIYTLSFSATGFNSQVMISSFEIARQYNVSRRLTESTGNGLNITFMMTDRSYYRSYEDVHIEARIENTGSPVEALVTFSLLDEQGKLVSEFSGKKLADNNEQVQFNVGELATITTSFTTANLKPGHYRLIGRVKVGDQLVGPATITLDEGSSEFDILARRKIESISIDSLPIDSVVGANKQFSIQATIQNRSNIDINDLSLSYKLVDPDGVVLLESGLISTPLSSKETVETFNLGSINTGFEKSGVYTLEVSDNLYLSGSKIPGLITVAPGFHIDINQSVSPPIIPPNENRRIRIDIRLEGLEAQ